MLSEKEKKFIVDRQDMYSLGELGEKLGRDPHEIYDCYSDMVDSGEYIKYYDKPKIFEVRKRIFKEDNMREILDVYVGKAKDFKGLKNKRAENIIKKLQEKEQNHIPRVD